MNTIFKQSLATLAFSVASYTAQASTISYQCVDQSGENQAVVTLGESSYHSSTSRESNGGFGDEPTEFWDATSFYEDKTAQSIFYGPYASPAFAFSVTRYDSTKDSYTTYADGRIVSHHLTEPQFFSGHFRETTGYGYEVSFYKAEDPSTEMEVFARIFAGVPFKSPQIARLVLNCHVTTNTNQTYFKQEMNLQTTLTPQQTVQAYFDSLASGDFAKLGNLLADDVVWHQPGSGALSGTYKGKEAVFALFGKFMEISGGSFKIDSVKNIMANDDLVTATLHFSAKKSVGQSISMDGADLMKIENGKIKEVHLFSEDQAAEDAFWIVK